MRDVLLITVDSLRADHLSAAGYERETTPCVDRLAANGHRFTSAFAHACATRASFPSILTSSTALMYGGYERLSENRTLVTEALPAAYRAGGFHSNLYLSAEFGYSRGFDTFFDSKSDPSPAARLKGAVEERLDEDGWLYGVLSRAVDTAEKEAGINVGSAYVRADEITERAIDWAESECDGPRFLWTHYMDVHHPYRPPERHQRALGVDLVPEREAIRLRRKMIEAPDEITDDERETLIDLYDAEIRFTDTEIGRLIEHVRETWGDDTMVIVTADHGEAFGEHGGYSHTQTFHDEMLHVPLIVDVGGDGSATTHDELVGLADVTPTIVEYAGGEQAESFVGHSLRPLLDGEGDWPREHVVGDWADGNRGGGERRFAYRDRRWKYIERGDGNVLYDLTADPGEYENVADGHPEVCERLRGVLDDHRERIAASADELRTVEMDESTKKRLRDLGYAE
ncbi:sulfatase [Halococcus thailandensis]|uniref:Sulfatase n=1 Tax=Halococcus thailandensis JCM 13552 TaxID=1227457 RepID=M0MVC3_9EURY|nr:sulfatase [Halococcus thailandensis]EMA49526.1 sulfatase [Halococcus thailandensis JCM 13552]